MPTPDGYPTASELEQVRTWQFEAGFVPLMEYITSIWWAADWGIRKTERGYRYYVSTGGWSGNEDIIDAMMENHLFWHLCWERSRKGGHYLFEIPPRFRWPQ